VTGENTESSPRRKPGDSVAVATVGRPVGLDGWCRIFPFGSTVEKVKLPYRFLLSDSRTQKHVTLKKIRREPGGCRALFEEFVTREAVDTIKNYQLMIQKEDLPALEAGEFYHFELEGLKVFTDTDKYVGTVTEVHNYPTTSALEITKENGGSLIVPITDEGVKEINREAGTIIIIESFSEQLL
jgi:16S rRNA processing protein RimM